MWKLIGISSASQISQNGRQSGWAKLGMPESCGLEHITMPFVPVAVHAVDLLDAARRCPTTARGHRQDAAAGALLQLAIAVVVDLDAGDAQRGVLDLQEVLVPEAAHVRVEDPWLMPMRSISSRRASQS